MPAFIGKISVGSLTINQPEGENHLEIIADVVLPIPTSPSEAVPVPLARFSFDVDRDAALKIGKDIQAKAEELKESPLIATDLNAVTQVADELERMKKGE